MLWLFNKGDWQNRKVSALYSDCFMHWFISDRIGIYLNYAAVNKDELLQMVRYGAEMVFSSKDSTITDEDIDRIIAKGEEATAELDAKMKKFTEDAIQFKMDDSKGVTYLLFPLLGCVNIVMF